MFVQPTTGPRLSTACLYNMKLSPQQLFVSADENVSPMSSLQTQSAFTNSHTVTVSPIDARPTYFSDEKIFIGIQAYDGIEVVPQPAPRAFIPTPTFTTLNPLQYSVGGSLAPPFHPSAANAQLPPRESQSRKVPFWRRYMLWIIAGVVLLALVVAGVVVGITQVRNRASASKGASNALNGTQTGVSGANTTVGAPVINKISVQNSTLASVASTGLTLADGTWNMHLFSQKGTSRQITLQVSLDGIAYQPYQNVTLTIKPRVGSPLSATVEEDSQTGVIMASLPLIDTPFEP